MTAFGAETVESCHSQGTEQTEISRVQSRPDRARGEYQLAACYRTFLRELG
jgi:hypothetical protein